MNKICTLSKFQSLLNPFSKWNYEIVFVRLCAPFLPTYLSVHNVYWCYLERHRVVCISKVEAYVLKITEGYIVMCQSETQPIYEIIWIVNVLRIPAILPIKQAYRPIVISVSIFLLLLAACNHIPPFAFQHEVECLIIFCHYSILSTLIGSPLSLQVKVSPR